MPISDATAIILITLLADYLFVYQRNKMIGSFLLIIIGFAALLTEAAQNAPSLIIIMIGIIAFLYSLFTKT